MDNGFSFGVLRKKQTRLRGFAVSAGAVCLGTFADNAVAVQRHFLKEVESLWRKTKFMLGHGQAASASFHGCFYRLKCLAVYLQWFGLKTWKTTWTSPEPLRIHRH
jgi:hypothetical protein